MYENQIAGTETLPVGHILAALGSLINDANSVSSREAEKIVCNPHPWHALEWCDDLLRASGRAKFIVELSADIKAVAEEELISLAVLRSVCGETLRRLARGLPRTGSSMPALIGTHAVGEGARLEPDYIWIMAERQ